MGTKLHQGGTTKLPQVAQGHMYVAKYTLDCEKTNRTSGDILEVIPVPKGHMVLAVSCTVRQKESAAGGETLEIGTTDTPGTDTNGFCESVALTTLGPTQGGTIGAYQITSTARPMFFAAAGTIDVKPLVNLDKCIVDIFAVIADMNFVDVP